MKKATTNMNIKADKGIHRSIMMEMGVYNIHKQKVVKSKKDYSRKDKHKGKNDE